MMFASFALSSIASRFFVWYKSTQMHIHLYQVTTLQRQMAYATGQYGKPFIFAMTMTFLSYGHTFGAIGIA
jgi:hypothetical protein